MRDLTLKRTMAIGCVAISMQCAIYTAVTEGNFQLLGMVMTSHSVLLGFMTILNGSD